MPSAIPADKEAQSRFTEWTTYLGYFTLILFGRIRDFFGNATGTSRYLEELSGKAQPGYAPLVSGWENFYTRRLFNRIQDCWNRPISSRPGREIDVICRDSSDNQKTMRLREDAPRKTCLNLGSYNYLGFADDWDNTCGEAVRSAVHKYGVGTCAPPLEGGTTDLHVELERVVADFVGKEASIVYNMGYGTNSTTIPALLGEGGLIVSDTLNHTSLVNGCRASGAKTKTFKHNDPEDLERVLRKAISEGRPAGAGQWKRILVMVEGIYSMEGEICELRRIVDVAKAHKCYVYVDEAHSIGALGRTGRGVCEHTGVDPAEIDILMGTFTKSFGGMGGYVAGDADLISYVRSQSAGTTLSNALSAVVCAQVLRSFSIIKGEACPGVGQEKLDSIKRNSNFFRRELKRMGCGVLGDNDSPVIPVMLYHPTKIAAFSRECFERDLAVVVVGAPAVPIYGSRARFCISAAHTKEDLVQALKKIKTVCKRLNLRYERSMFG